MSAYNIYVLSDPKDKRAGPGTELKMFLVRVCLGEMYVTDKVNGFARPPCMKCYLDKCMCNDNEFFDSVVGDQSWIFREFVVYEKALVYPEYLITYTRN